VTSPLRALGPICCLAACHPPDPGFDVVLVSIDGTPPALLDEEWSSLHTIPLLAEGGSRQALQVQGVTDTIASHARLLTGYGDDLTGIVSASHWAPVPEGLSLQERLRGAFGEGMRIYWVVNKPHMLGFGDPSEPFYFAGQAADDPVVRTMIIDITPDMVAALRTTGNLPFFAFFHWGGVDQAGHEFGERSEEQRAALHHVDDQLRVVRDELHALGRLERTRFYVTTDHGFDPDGSSHYIDAADVFLLTNDPAIGTGTVTEQLPWTLLHAWGVNDADLPTAPVEPL
jgi:hypothetical protein